MKTSKNSDKANDEKKKVDKTSELDDLKSQLQRLQAEFENYRKRTDTEKEGLKNFYLGDFISKLIPVLDHFELAIQHECADKNYAMGVQMIYRSLLEVLRSEGVEEISVEGKPFDSSIAEVVSVKHESGEDDNVVIEVKNKGYMLKDTVIRRARVVVNKKDLKKDTFEEEKTDEQS